MKIKLLNDGRYEGMDKVKFPIEVEAEEDDDGFTVLGSEIIRVGGSPGAWDTESKYFWFNSEVEVLP